MGEIVDGWLAGFEPELRPVLSKARVWLEESMTREPIVAGPPGTQYFYGSQRANAYGLCRWMLDGANHEAAYVDALNNYDLHFQFGGYKSIPLKFNWETQRFDDPFIRGIPMTDKEIREGSLDDYLAACIQCGQFGRGVAVYERVGARTDIAPNRIQHALHFGYWVCRTKQDGSFSQSECLKIGSRVLRSNLQGKWLNCGQNRRAAQWLKIVFSDAKEDVKPLDIILKAYDLMPDVTRPGFLS